MKIPGDKDKSLRLEKDSGAQEILGKTRGLPSYLKELTDNTNCCKSCNTNSKIQK